MGFHEQRQKIRSCQRAPVARRAIMPWWSCSIPAFASPWYASAQPCKIAPYALQCGNPGPWRGGERLRMLLGGMSFAAELMEDGRFAQVKLRLSGCAIWCARVTAS